MVSESEVKRYARETLKLLHEIDQLRSLLKKPAGIHLSEAGKAIIAVGIERGMTQAQIARLLDVSAPAVSRHVGNI